MPEEKIRFGKQQHDSLKWKRTVMCCFIVYSETAIFYGCANKGYKSVLTYFHICAFQKYIVKNVWRCKPTGGKTSSFSWKS